MASINELVKSTVKTMSDKNDVKIAAANNEILQTVRNTVVNEVIVREIGVNINELASKNDLSSKADKSELENKADVALLENKADKVSLNDKVDKKDIFKNGVFHTGWTAEDGSTHEFIAEANDFGGVFGYNKPRDIKSYIGLNKSLTDGELDGQIYAINKTSNIGMRINFNKDGAYYLTGTKNIGTPASREIAVKGDIPDVSQFIKQADIDNKAEQSTVDELNAIVAQKADKSEIPDVSSFVNIEALNSKADKNDTYTKEEVVSLLEGKANLDDVYKKVETYSMDKIQELLDLEANKDTVYTIEQVDTKLSDKVDKKDIFTNNGTGVFSTGWQDNDGSTHKIELEAGDFGGIFGYNAPKNIKSYVGLNKSGEDNIDGQIYAINPDTKIGMRINFGSQGAYYLNNSDNLGTPAGREIAVKEDIPDISNFATKEDLDTLVSDNELEALENRFNNDLSNKADKNDIPDVSHYATINEVATKVSNDEFNTFKSNVNTSLANKLEQDSINTLSSQIDNKLALKADKSDLNGLATEQFVVDHMYDDTNIVNAVNAKIDSSKVWNATGNYFDTTYTHANGSYAKVWNESDGGGSQVYDKSANIISYIGTNLEENKSASDDAINVQIYSKNKSTNEGVRINVNTKKAYYLKGANKANDANRELVVKEDLNDLITREEAQQMVDNAIANLLQQIQAELNAQ